MARQRPPLSAYGLTEASTDTCGDLELENFEELHQTFTDVALVMGERIDRGSGSLLVTNRYSKFPAIGELRLGSCPSLSLSEALSKKV